MTRPQSRSFRNRLLLSFLIASLVPMIICSTMLSQISRIQMKKQMETDELIGYWAELVGKYPIFSIEDGLDQTDFDGWRRLT